MPRTYQSAHASERGLSPADDSTYPILNILERLFHPQAQADERALAKIIRTLAHYVRYCPLSTSDEDLEILLAVSLALRSRRPRP